ncbi:MAG: T9SS type A sorting domain-containing protein [Bacteroidetes bacterium]|nr:T9SS type A sorting domain-containing protein [Bacteroidota bacterium]
MKKQFLLSVLLTVTVSSLIAQGNWSQKASFSNSPLSKAVAFSIGDKGYVVSGADTIVGLSNDTWEYDPATDVWTQKADLGGVARRFAVGLATEEFGYVGLGEGLGSDPADFWQFNPVSNIWTKKANFPGGSREWATGFSIGDKGYIGNGYESKGKKDFWEYDPAANSWSQIADLAGTGRSGSVGFSIGNKGYACTGAVNNTGATDELWEFDPSTGQWTEKAAFPGQARAYAVGFVLNGKGYVGCGLDENGNALSDFYAYDPVTDSWEEAAALPGPARYWAVGFSINGKGYVGTGQENSNQYLDDFWEYTPAECTTPTNPQTTNISGHSAKLQWTSSAGATKYKVLYKIDNIGAVWISKTVSASTTALTIAGLLPNTVYKWKVRSICGSQQSDYSSASYFTTSLKLENQIEEEIYLDVYPNPFSSQALISFFLEEASQTTLDVFDLAGRKVQTVLNNSLEAGRHEVKLNNELLNEGIYFLKLTVRGKTSITKAVAH